MIDTNLYTDYPYYGAHTADDINYDPNKVRIKSLLWKNYDWIKKLDETGKARPCVLDNVQKTMLCNTFDMGYDLFECPVCHNYQIICRKCHCRFCNSCGVKTQKILALKAENMCVDVPHRHIVFTIPENYRILFRIDRSALNLLFVASRNTICKMFNENLFRKEKNRQKKTGKIRNDKDNYYLYRNHKYANRFGMISTIHTFGRSLSWNPHVHALVPELYYDPKKKKITHHSFFSYKNLRKTFQYELNRLLFEHFGKQFKKYVDENYEDHPDGFYVYAKDPKDTEQSSSKPISKNVQGCVNYMMRYAARPAMAESRIVSYCKDTDQITWFYDDHATNERITVIESSKEFLKKLFIHIPDENFRMIRGYGFYNPKEWKLLNEIHTQIGNTAKVNKDKEEKKQKLNQLLKKVRLRTLCLDSFNRDLLRCKCGSLMLYSDSYDPLEGRTNDRSYRQSCIDEVQKMRLRGIGPSG